jgi:hypothetical protein
VLTDLNLHGDTPVRVQPQIGEWGPAEVPSTRRKRLTRWLWGSAFVAVSAALFAFGHWVYGIVMTSGG